MQTTDKYWESYNFIICYFGDYREGRTEEDILREALKESSSTYIKDVINNLELLTNDQTIDYVKFLESCNVYMENNEKALNWIKLITNSLKKLIIY